MEIYDLQVTRYMILIFCMYIKKEEEASFMF